MSCSQDAKKATAGVPRGRKTVDEGALRELVELLVEMREGHLRRNLHSELVKPDPV